MKYRWIDGWIDTHIDKLSYWSQRKIKRKKKVNENNIIQTLRNQL